MPAKKNEEKTRKVEKAEERDRSRRFTQTLNGRDENLSA